MRGLDYKMDVADGHIQFAIHSVYPDDPEDKRVDAGVFASKLGRLVAALRAADKAVNNGVATHEYTIDRLHTSTPTAVLAERPLGPNLLAHSGIGGFERCAAAITLGKTVEAMEFGTCAEHVEKLAIGADKRFSYAEIGLSNNVIRVDHFLRERARAARDPEKAAKRGVTQKQWFKGAAFGSFVGKVQVADLRGQLPAIKLILPAGGKALDCVCYGIGDEEIRAALNRRVRLSGRAIYDGKTGLPRRIEVREIQHMAAEGDFTAWRGAFDPFTLPDWDGDLDDI